MAIFEAVGLLGSAAFEAASLVWMELSMFTVAAFAYILYVGVQRPQRHKVGKAAKSPKGGRAPVQPELSDNHRQALALWKGARSASCDLPQLDIALVVDAMQKSGKAVAEVASELRKGVGENPKLLSTVACLPTALLRDDAIELLDATMVLLEENGQPAEAATYAGLMAAHLRRRNYDVVASIGARQASEHLTPKMHGMLAASAAHRGLLTESFEHMGKITEPAEGSKSAFPPSATAQVLLLSLREERMTAVAQQLQRIQARLDAKHFEELLMSEGWKRTPAVCQELLDVATSLGVPVGPTAYRSLANALMHAADKSGLMQLIAKLEQEQESKSTPRGLVTEPLAMALLGACRATSDGDLALRVLDMHREVSTGAASNKVLSATCTVLLMCERKQAACELYEKQMAARGLSPDATLTNGLMKAAAAVGKTELAQTLLDHASSMRTVTSSSNLTSGSELQRHAAMIKAYARERNLKSAEAVFNRLRESELALTPLIYNCFLDACAQCGDFPRAAAHFDEMKQLGCIDVVSFNTMIKVHLAQGHMDKVRALMAEMSELGFQANKVTFNEMLHARVLAKDKQGMWSIVKEMQQASIRANPVTCSILLKSLTHDTSEAEVRRVVALIEEMEEGIDEVLFSSVIEACIRNSQLGLLSEVMRRYRHKDRLVNLSAPSYGSMIKAYGQAGDIERVRELWEEMEALSVKPTAITIGCLTEALVMNNQTDEAWALLQKLLASEELRFCINTVIYTTVLKGFAYTKRMDRVFAVYDEMRAKKIPCNTITFNTLLDACAKSCTMSRGAQLLEDMASMGVEPDIITYSTFIKGYCAEGDVDRAFHILEEMKRDNKFTPDEIMYNSFLDGCAKQHRVDDAMKILDEMRSAGVRPSNFTLSILVKCLGHARRLNQAFKMVEDLSTENKFRPNVQVYTCLVQACVLNKRLDKALALHETMVGESGCRVDEKLYGTLARGCLQLHQPLKAAEVVRAAYQLSGHSLGMPARRHAPVGMDARTLEEVCMKLKQGSREEQAALDRLSSDLESNRGLRINDLLRGGGAGSQSRGGAGGNQGRRGGGGGRFN